MDNEKVLLEKIIFLIAENKEITVEDKNFILGMLKALFYLIDCNSEQDIKLHELHGVELQQYFPLGYYVKKE